MENLKILKNEALLDRCDRIVKAEKKLTKLAIEHFAEVDRRRLYLQTHASLFDFLTQRYGYSAGSAQRRIDAARLYNEIPEIAQKIESGDLNLVQISQIQKATRQAKKQGRTIQTEEKRIVIESISDSISGKPQADQKTEILIAQCFELPIERKSRKQFHADESVTRVDHYSKEENEIIQKAWDLVSHSVPGSEFKDFVLYLAKRVIATKTQPPRPKSQTSTTTVEVNLDPTATMEVNSNPKCPESEGSCNTVAGGRSAIPLDVRRQTFHRDLCCQFRLQDGRLCESTKFLQMDHIQPVWAGGTDAPENLRVLCGAHNRERYRGGSSRANSGDNR